MAKRCPTCGGAGYLVQWYGKKKSRIECWTCHGTGQVG